MLEAEGVNLQDEVNTHNILIEDNMRDELKDYSDWPTFPQVFFRPNFAKNILEIMKFKVYLKGEFYAGCDIMYEDYKQEKLRAILLEAGLSLPKL